MNDQLVKRIADQGKRSRYPFAVDPRTGAKSRVFPSEEAARLAEVFLRRLADAEGVNVPRVRGRDGRTLVVDFLPGTPLTARPDRAMIVTVAALQARLHAVDWPGHDDREACAENYRRFFGEYLAVYEHLGLLRDAEAKQARRRFEAAIPWRMHPALIHDDLWGGNVLFHEGDVFLIDYASVKALALESDLLNTARYFRTRRERWTRGAHSLRTRYVRAYAEHGERMAEVVQEVEANHAFFAAFNLLRKGSNMLLRARGDAAGSQPSLRFARRQLRDARRALRA